MKRRAFLTGSAVAAAAAALTPAPASAQTMNWRMANLYPRGISFGVAYDGYAENVGVMTGGRLTVDMLYDGEGVSATEILGATRSGLVEMGAPYMALHAGELPAGVVELGLPGAPTALNELLALFNETEFGSVLNEAFASIGVHRMAPLFQPGVYLITKEPIASLSDVEGLTLRSPGGYGKFMEILGAKPVSMAFSEGYTSLATGVIDGAASSNLIDYRDGSWYEQAPYICPHPLTGAQVAPTIANLDVFNALPDDLKAIHEAAAIVHGVDQANKSTMWASEAVSEMLSKGMQWGPTLSADDQRRWAEAGDAVLEEYASGDEFSSRLVAIQREFVARMSG